MANPGNMQEFAFQGTFGPNPGADLIAAGLVQWDANANGGDGNGETAQWVSIVTLATSNEGNPRARILVRTETWTSDDSDLLSSVIAAHVPADPNPPTPDE